MTETDETKAAAEEIPWVAFGIAGFKVILALALIRILAVPFTEDMFGEAMLPMPTWEWSLCSLTPVIVIWRARHPDAWKTLMGERTLLTIALTYYLLYAFVSALFQGEWMLRPAVAASAGGLAGMTTATTRRSVRDRRDGKRRPVTTSGHTRTYGGLGEGPTGLARLCLVVGVSSIFLVMFTRVLPRSAGDAVYCFQRTLVVAAVLTLLVLFFKHPLPSRRPEGLTEVFAFSPSLFLAAWVTGVWAGVFVAPLVPLLALGSWVAEKLRRV